MTKHRSTSVVVVVALSLLGAVLRIPGLDSGLWFDEIVTLVESVRLPFLQVVSAFPGNNNHPFYSLLAHLSVAAFGDHAWTLRLPAMLFGVAAIPLVYWLGRQVTTRGEALMTALLMAVAYHAVWFAQNARGYTILLAFTLVTTTLVVRLLERPDAKRALVYGVAAGLGIYTHLTMVFVVVAHALVWAWSVWRARESVRNAQLWTALSGLVTSGAVAGLLYLPMIREVYGYFAGPPPSTAAVATSSWAAAEMIKGLLVGFGGVGFLASAALLAVGGLSYLRRSPVVTALFVLPGLLTGAAVVVLHTAIRPRFFFMMAGFALLVLVRGAMVLGEYASRWLRIERAALPGEIAVGVVALFSLWSLGFNYRYPKQDFESAQQFVDAQQSPGDGIGTAGLARYPFEHYYLRQWTPLETGGDFERLVRAGRAWVVYSFPEYMDPGLVAQIRRDCPVQATFPGTLGGGAVVVCLASGPAAPPDPRRQ